LWGWDFGAGLVFELAISVGSTVVLLLALVALALIAGLL
jgi:predicted Kef-type K+ transport protein